MAAPGASSEAGSGSLRTVEIEQAMHTLRKRLSMAAVQAHVPHPWGTSEQHAGSLSPPSHTSNAHAESSTSPQSSSATSFATLSEEQERTSSESSPDRDVMHSHNDQPLLVSFDKRAPALGRPFQEAAQAAHAPSLYDVVFGASPLSKSRNNNGSAARSAEYGTYPQKQSSPSQRSPHVRQGSSARLERLALSPQLGSPEHSSGRLDEHNHPSSYQLAVESRTGSTSEWHGHAQQDAEMGQMTPPRSARSGFTFTSQPTLPSTQMTSRQPRTPQHRRNRSLGGSLLPNGHPASSLAQDLGIASGSTRTPRSKQAASFSRLTHGASPRASSTSTFVDPNLLTPRRKYNATSAQRNGGTPPQRGSSEEDDESSEAAAHSLLDLAASPSPLRKSSVARFAGHAPDFRQEAANAHRRTSSDRSHDLPQGDDTDMAFARPVKKRLVDGFNTSHSRQSEPEAFALPLLPQTPSRSRGHLRASSHGALRAMQTPPSAKSHAVSFDRSTDMGDVFSTPQRNAFDRHKRTSSASGGRIRLMSPPMTPPRSDDVKPTKRVHYQSMEDIDMPASPKTPTKVAAHQRSASMSEHGGLGQGRALERIIETPHTPPQAASTPQTPKAPGSNFSYGDFLHVSPSPQPRARTFSQQHGNAGSPGSASGQEKQMLFSLAETPSRSSRKSTSRMLDFASGMSSATAMSKSPAHDGDAAHAVTGTQGLGMMGLGSAFEQQQELPEPMLDVAAGDEAYVLVPGRRAVPSTRKEVHGTVRDQQIPDNEERGPFAAMSTPLTPMQRRAAFRPT